ncbi:hypothetical protein B0T18DRAFT_422662 [Schizothecium vesticola]|uniref:NACHT domain-containing protein n=1 Tax=Schizothecium vesticola TaxID=314040 RepID=A0AA40BQW4_9PEZI|nr:hypothetical protein B0T18DRAFT_422662 [Schizothecium vesticola]
MSGLEPLVALGLACNVFQTVSFAREVCQVSKTVLETGDVPPPALASTLKDLAKVFREVESTTAVPNTKLTSCDRELVKIAKVCSEAAAAMKQELDKTQATPTSGKGRWSGSWVTVKAVAGASSRKKKLEKLEQLVETHQKALETRLLANICTKTDAIKVSQQTNFESLDIRLQGFIKLVGQGETRMAALLIQETANVKDHITVKTNELGQSLGQISRDNERAYQGISQATMEVGANITTLTRRTDDKADQDRKYARHDRLLKSLKYGTMNERRNQIEHPHTKTFQWIFGDAPTQLDGYSKRIHEAAAGFIEWARDQSSPTFWISGKPGSGKSTLMKFLAENPRTLELLTSASPAASQTTILSHFIWSAGQPIEATVKGLLYSLLYQALSEQSASEAVLEKHPGARTKDSVSDWSEDELQVVLFKLLPALGRPLCLFIDGLDEISSPVGQFQVLDIIKSLQQIPLPFVKTCVSSRPEPILQQSLGQYPMFKIQDLTRFDIERFAAHTLKAAFERSQLNLGENNLKDSGELLEHVCEMADGVFLWVALAVRSLKTGLVKGDGPKELDQRLQALPSDLATLYNLMWDRLGDEKEIYQRDAARYFNLLQVEPYSVSGPPDHENSLVVILLAYDRSLSQRILKDYNDNRRPISYDTLSHHLKRQRIRLEARCAGLVEVRNSPSDRFGLGRYDLDWRPDWMADKLYFIHRSARDFILNQSGPERLLDKDESTRDMRLSSTALAHLAACCLEGGLLYRLGTDLPLVTAGGLRYRPGTDLPLVIALVSCIFRTPSGGTSSVPHQLVTECGRLIGRSFRRSQKPRSQACRHYDFGAILSWCLPIELLKTAFLPIPRGLCGKYAAYLFIGAMGRIGQGQDRDFRIGMIEPRSELAPSPKVNWLCEIAQVVDLGFQGVVCSNLYSAGPAIKGCLKINAPHTPLSATVQCLQEWTSRYWWWSEENGFWTRYNLGGSILNILRSLLAGSPDQGHLAYPTVIAIRAPLSLAVASTILGMELPAGSKAENPDFVWGLVTQIEALNMASSLPKHWKPAVFVKTNMRLAVALLAADMRRWGEEDLCGLLLHQLGDGAPFDIKITEILAPAKWNSDSASPPLINRRGPKFKITWGLRDLARIEDIFITYLKSALTEDRPSRAGIGSQRKDLLQDLQSLIQDILDSVDRGSTVEERWADAQKRWVRDEFLWKKDDVRAQPPGGDVLGKMYGSWAEKGESEGSDSEESDSEERESEESESEESESEEGRINRMLDSLRR